MKAVNKRPFDPATWTPAPDLDWEDSGYKPGVLESLSDEELTREERFQRDKEYPLWEIWKERQRQGHGYGGRTFKNPVK